LGEVRFLLTFVELPFSIIVRSAEHADGTTDRRHAEIRDCFASVYDLDAYDAIQDSVSTTESGMQLRFVPKG
jgi:hypothetical protein